MPRRTEVFLSLLGLFLTALGLRRCAEALSSCVEWELLFFMACWLLMAPTSLVAERGPRRAGSAVVVLSFPHRARDLQGPGMEPVTPSLAGRFLTTGPPGRSRRVFLSIFLGRPRYPASGFLRE